MKKFQTSLYRTEDEMIQTVLGRTERCKISEMPTLLRHLAAWWIESKTLFHCESRDIWVAHRHCAALLKFRETHHRVDKYTPLQTHVPSPEMPSHPEMLALEHVLAYGRTAEEPLVPPSMDDLRRVRDFNYEDLKRKDLFHIE